MSEAVILVERPSSGVMLLRINRPGARNAMNLEVRKSLVGYLESAASDQEVRAIIIAGNEKSFAAGADIKEMEGVGAIEHLQRGTHKLWRAIYSCPKPVIAAVRGYALGGGCELAMTCDIIVAGVSAKFGQPEVKIGVIPGGGGTQRLTRAVGKFRAMHYVLTGEIFSGQEAFEMGLASVTVPDADVEDRAIAIAEKIANMPPLAMLFAKECVLAAEEGSLSMGLAFEGKCGHMFYSSEDQKEGRSAFLEKRIPVFRGR